MDQQTILAILAKYGSTMTPDALRQADAELRALGITQEFNSAGEPRGRLYLPDGRTVDLGDFGGPWQWVDRGVMGGGGDTSGGGGDTSGGGDTGGSGGSVSSVGGVGSNGLPTPGPAGVLNTAGITEALRGTPGYQFAFSEGQRGIQSSAAARGTLLTGGTLKALAQYGTGLADQTYGEAVNRYQNLAELGARVATSPI